MPQWLKDFRSFWTSMWDEEIKAILVSFMLLYAGGYLLAVGYIQMTAASYAHPVWGALVAIVVIALVTGTVEKWMDTADLYRNVDDSRKYGNSLALLCAVIFLPIVLNSTSQLLEGNLYKDLIFKIRFWPSAILLFGTMLLDLYILAGRKYWNRRFHKSSGRIRS